MVIPRFSCDTSLLREFTGRRHSGTLPRHGYFRLKDWEPKAKAKLTPGEDNVPGCGFE
jgi:hypothetical protein